MESVKADKPRCPVCTEFMFKIGMAEAEELSAVLRDFLNHQLDECRYYARSGGGANAR